jgi:tripartite-type tricarboxylate transporter receptor subunit TctC
MTPERMSVMAPRKNQISIANSNFNGVRSMRKLLLWVGYAVLMLAAPVHAQSAFPNKTVSLIVPFPPGGAADNPARFIGQSLFGIWKQSVVTLNRPGAGGALGMGVAARSAPDGYTLLVTNPSVLIVPEADRVFGRESSFDRASFTPLALLVADPIVLAVKADAPWKTYQEFVAAARANPDTITYASSGAYSASHLPIEMLANAAGIKLRHVPYSGGGPAIIAVLGGQVAATASSPSALAAHFKSGALRPLVNTGATRIAALPDVPTAIELGYKDVEFYLWIGMFAPAKTPNAIVQTIRADIGRAIKLENGFAHNMAKLGAPIDYRDGPAFVDFLNKDAERIKAAIQRIGRVD